MMNIPPTRSKKVFLLFFWLWFLLFNAYSQELPPWEKIDSYINNTEFNKAILLIDITLENTSSWEDILQLNNKKADALIRNNQIDEAQQVLSNIQQTLSEHPNPFYHAITLSNLGYLQLNLGRSDLAEETLKKALTQFEASGQDKGIEIAQALSHLGLVYLNTGQYSLAEDQLRRALSLRQKKLNPTHELVAATFNDLGLVYSQTNKEKALDYYEKALSIYQDLHGTENLKVAFTRINAGIVYRDLEFYGDAINSLEMAMTIFSATYPEAHPTKAITLYNLGQTYLKMDQHKTAQKYYDQALSLYLKSYGDKHPEVANVYNALGNLLQSQARYDSALIRYQQALVANVADFSSMDITANPSLSHYYNGIRLLQSLLFKAQALEAKYLDKSIKFQDLKLALSTLDRCDALIDILRQHSTNENDKILLGVVANEVYTDGVRIAYTAAQNAWNKKYYFERCFYFAEKSKSAVLLESISESHAKSFAGIPDELLEEEKALKSAIAFCARELAERPVAEKEKILREKSFQLTRDYEHFITNLEKSYPEYFNLKFNITTPSSSALQAILDEQTTLLSYFTDESNHRIYIFQITRKQFKITEKNLPDDFDRQITGLRNSMFYSDIKVFGQTANPLYRLLIPSCSGKTKKLIILPTGRLSVIPFEALLTRKYQGESFSKLDYLITEFSVQYEFSAGLLLLKSQHKTSRNEAPSILLCAPIQFPHNNLPELPGTQNEVDEIGELFAQKKLPHVIVTHIEANESLLKSNTLSQYKFLHLATHGTVNESNPELSCIFLQQDSTKEDGQLYTGEIYNLELNASLVTLSACQTGLGKISKGEGVIGLSRALVYAGAEYIMVSYWSVADQSTAILMQTFYKEFLSHPSIGFSTNLRKSKLKLIQSDTHSSPYYWAPFVLIGF